MRLRLRQGPSDRWSQAEKSWTHKELDGEQQHPLRLTKRGERVLAVAFLLGFLFLLALAGGIEQGTL